MAVAVAAAVVVVVARGVAAAPRVLREVAVRNGPRVVVAVVQNGHQADRVPRADHVRPVVRAPPEAALAISNARLVAAAVRDRRSYHPAADRISVAAAVCHRLLRSGRQAEIVRRLAAARRSCRRLVQAADRGQVRTARALAVATVRRNCLRVPVASIARVARIGPTSVQEAGLRNFPPSPAAVSRIGPAPSPASVQVRATSATSSASQVALPRVALSAARSPIARRNFPQTVPV